MIFKALKIAVLHDFNINKDNLQRGKTITFRKCIKRVKKKKKKKKLTFENERNALIDRIRILGIELELQSWTNQMKY